MLAAQITAELTKVLGTPVKLLRPKHPVFGDYSFHAHTTSLKPEDIHKKLSESRLFSKVEQAGAFINLTVKPEILAQNLSPAPPMPTSTTSKRIQIEYGTANTHKLPHIGHFYSYSYGESLSRILEHTGNTIRRGNYQGDVGPHVAKCLYIVQQKASKISELASLSQKAAFLQTCYQEGSAAYDDSPEAHSAIDDLNQKIYSLEDPDITHLWKETRQWSIDYCTEFEKNIGTNQDVHFYESQTWKKGLELVKNNVGTIFEESDGALVFKGEKYGLHTRVFVTSRGTPTYESKDIGLAQLKKDDWAFDTCIIITGNDQTGYWKVVKQASELVFPDLKGKIEHIGHGTVGLTTGKMSSRTGEIISAIDLLELVKKRITETHLSDNPDAENISAILAVGAIKYAFLKSDAFKNITFDIEQSISLSGNSGPYIQYGYARMRSILRKGPAASPDEHYTLDTSSMTLSEHDSDLLRTLARFQDVVAEAAQEHAPHVIATYLFELVQSFNSLYEHDSILKAPDTERDQRLALTHAASETVKAGLNLLGINVLDQL